MRGCVGLDLDAYKHRESSVGRRATRSNSRGSRRGFGHRRLVGLHTHTRVLPVATVPAGLIDDRAATGIFAARRLRHGLCVSGRRVSNHRASTLHSRHRAHTSFSALPVTATRAQAHADISRNGKGPHGAVRQDDCQDRLQQKRPAVLIDTRAKFACVHKLDDPMIVSMVKYFAWVASCWSSLSC